MYLPLKAPAYDVTCLRQHHQKHQQFVKIKNYALLHYFIPTLGANNMLILTPILTGGRKIVVYCVGSVEIQV